MKLLSVKLKKEASSLFPDGYPHFIQSGQAKSPLTLVPHPGDLFYLCGNAVHDFFNYAFGISLKTSIQSGLKFTTSREKPGYRSKRS